MLASALGSLSLSSDTALLRFWSALGAAELDEQHSVLTLPAGCTWLGDSRRTRTMYVRSCYPLLYQRLAGQHCAVLLGTPGIGKTMFGLYLLWRRLREREAPSGGHGPVVYQSAEGLCVVLHEGRPHMYAQGAFAVTELLLRDDTYYVVGRTPEQVRAHTRAGDVRGIAHHLAQALCLGQVGDTTQCSAALCTRLLPSGATRLPRVLLPTHTRSAGARPVRPLGRFSPVRAGPMQ